MINEHQLPNSAALSILGRILFTLLFFISGVGHFTSIPYYESLLPGWVPFGVFLVLVSGVVELAGAVMILFNWRPRLGGWLLVIFLVPVTFVIHGYLMLNAEQEAVRGIQQVMFIKGLSLIGAALIITQVGVGSQKSETVKSQ